MSLFSYEIKKVFSKRLIWVILGFFLLLDIVKIGMLYNDTVVKDTLSDGRQAVIDEIKGSITNEKISFVIGKKRELDELVGNRTYKTEYDSSTYTGYWFGDSIVFGKIYDDLDYAYHYTESLNRIKTKAEENLTIYPNDSYEAVRSQKILDVYGEREIKSYYDTIGYETYFSYDFSVLLILLFLLVSITPVFSEEREIGMNLLILSSPNGKRSTTKVKLSSVIAITFGVTILFLLLDFFLFFFLFNLEGGNNPLYSLKSFAYTPLNISILQYVFLSSFLKLLGSLFFSLLYAFFSSACKSVLMSMAGAVGTLLLLVFCNDFVSIDLFKYLSPVSLFKNRILFQSYTSLNFFRIPVDGSCLLLLFTVALIGVLFAVIPKFQNNIGISKRKNRRARI